MKYDMTTPCPKCPFRTDIPAFLTTGRAREIADSLKGGSDFPCHNTVDYTHENEDGEVEPRVPQSARACAGALLVTERDLGYPNQIQREFGDSARLVFVCEAREGL